MRVANSSALVVGKSASFSSICLRYSSVFSSRSETSARERPAPSRTARISRPMGATTWFSSSTPPEPRLLQTLLQLAFDAGLNCVWQFCGFLIQPMINRSIVQFHRHITRLHPASQKFGQEVFIHGLVLLALQRLWPAVLVCRERACDIHAQSLRSYPPTWRFARTGSRVRAT